MNNQNKQITSEQLENTIKLLTSHPKGWSVLTFDAQQGLLALTRQGLQLKEAQELLKSAESFGNERDKTCSDLLEQLKKLTAELESLRKDKERLDYIEAGLFQRFPEHPFHKLERGPHLDEITLTMYNGRTTFWATERNLRTAIDSAMEKEKSV